MVATIASMFVPFCLIRAIRADVSGAGRAAFILQQRQTYISHSRAIPFEGDACEAGLEIHRQSAALLVQSSKGIHVWLGPKGTFHHDEETRLELVSLPIRDRN